MKHKRLAAALYGSAATVLSLAIPLAASGGVAKAISSCPTDLLSSLTPTTTDFTADSSAINVGALFNVHGAPYVSGVSFYKGTDNTGTHVAHLYDVTTSTDLASATYTSESSSGWQTVDFSSPVDVSQSDTYEVWVSMPNGNYAVDGGSAGGTQDFYSQGYGNAAPDGDVAYIPRGMSGTYSYTSDPSAAPAHTSYSNYWVSPVVGDSTAPNDTTFSVADATGGPTMSWTQGYDTNSATSLAGVSKTTIQRIQGESFTTIGVQSGGGAEWEGIDGEQQDNTALPGTTYEYRLTNTDACGNVSSGTTHFVTTASQSLSNLFGNSAPATLDSGQTTPVTVGMHWQTSTAGNVWGARIYRASGSNPAGSGYLSVGLWDGTGTLLSQAFVAPGNQQSGWIDVRFPSPVSVSANHDYVIGYFSSNGQEMYTSGGLSSGASNGDLSAQADSLTTPNGVYATGSSLTFPSNESTTANWYGVDVDFYE